MEQNKKPRHIGKILLMTAAAVLFLPGCGNEYFVLHPAGPVGQTEYHLIVLSTILVAIVIIPVILLLAFIVIRYRDKPNNRAPYRPEWSESKTLEIIWWGIPILIIAILGVFTAKTTFALTRPPQSGTSTKPMTVYVTSLDWKWLFEYPGQNVATVNYVEIPTNVPINFVLTSDAPMNSFWVPQLGGQEYTMPGMAMRLWLEADKPGTYFGTGANFSGVGFSHMHFNVIAKSQSEFDSWVQQVKSTQPALTKAGYDNLVKPSTLDGTESFSSFPAGLFNDTVSKNGGQYMGNMLKDTTGTGQSGNMSSSSRMGSMDMNNMSGMNK